MIVIGSSLACLGKRILLNGLSEVKCLGFFNAKFKVAVKTQNKHKHRRLFKKYTLLEAKPEIIIKPLPNNKNYKKLFLVSLSTILGF